MSTNTSLNTSTVEEKKPRLIITNIIVENFKSYAGKREIGPFHESFTCIVGPNGSGKSNVIDSIQFVFGKRGNKIRLKKLSELIHRSENHQNLKFAKVSVFFEEIIDEVKIPFKLTPINKNDKYKFVEGTKFNISRSVNDKSASQYYINDKRSNFTEVTDMLKAKGIDLDNNRFLILQGEVEQISLMKPKAPNEHEDGLLEYIEDIVGTNKYQEMIKTAEENVDKINEERTEKLNRVKISEKDKESLEGSKNDALEFVHKKKEQIRTKAKLIQLKEKQDLEKKEESLQKREELTEKNEAEIKKLDESIQKAKETEKSYKEGKKKYDEIFNELNDVKKEFQKFERQHIEVKEDEEYLENREKNLKKEIEQSLKKIDDFQKKIDNSDADEAKEQKELSKMIPQLKEAEYSVEKIIEGIQDEIGPLRIEVEEKQKQLIPFKNEVNEIQQNIDITNGELNLLNRSSDSLDKKIEDSKGKFELISKEIKEKGQELKQAEATLETVNKKIPYLKEELTKISGDEEKLDNEYFKKSSLFETLKSQQASATSSSKVLSAIMKAKSNETIDGICDRLGNLGAIDKKYDVAISTACPALNSIVVENTKSAKHCVEYLRKNQLGVATFLMIDEISKGRHASKATQTIQTPKNVPRLFDLVKPKDQKYKVVFYHALRDTLVAKDLKEGTEIAYGKVDGKRYRVVTLKGELIELTGVMSGGGNKVMSGGMSSVIKSDVSKEIKEVERDLRQLSGDLKELRSSKADITTQYKKFEGSVEELTHEISKIKMEQKSLESKHKDLSKKIKDLESEKMTLKKDEKKIQSLHKNLEKYQKELTRVKKNFSSIEEEIEDLQRQINEAGGNRLKLCKDKVEKLTKLIQESNSKITKIQVQKETAQKGIPKLKKKVESNQVELDQMNDKLISVTEKKKDIETKAEAVLKEQMKVKAILEETEEDLLQKEKEYAEYKGIVDKVKLLQVELKNQLDDCDKEIEMYDKSSRSHSKAFQKCEVDIKEYDEFDKNEKDDSLRLTNEELDEIDENDIGYKFSILDAELNNLKDKINLSSIKEYLEKEKIYLERLSELEKITEIRNQQQKEYDELRKKRLDEFMKGFSLISMKLKEIYQMITLGGDAELELVDSLDPFSEGIIFSVRPPKKSWKNISNLSGGEKTLSSLALVFALHHYKPTPIYVMDEIDAALDFRNVSIIANYIKERTKNVAQFIVISLRNNMFELGDRLVGIYKTDNVTKTVCIDPNSIENKLISSSTDKPTTTTSTTTSKKVSKNKSKNQEKQKTNETIESL
eukprot:gene698-8950_t